MRKIILLLLIGLLNIGMVSAFSGAGSGTGADPFIITTCAQLQEMKDNLTASYKLFNNINCNVAPFNTGAGFEPVGTSLNRFQGKFNGDYFSITGLFINRPTTDFVGLFGDAPNIQNVSLIDVNITGRDNVGGLLGFRRFVFIRNVSVSGTVKGRNSVGLMAGAMFGATLLNDDATGTVSGSTKVGGLVGEIQRASFVNNSFAIADVSGSSEVGGLAGNFGRFQLGALMENSYAEGTVTGSNTVGGLVGRLIRRAVINNSNSGATVIATSGSSAGGLVGSSSGTIDNSFATGSVSGIFFVGGLLGGGSRFSSVSNSFATGNVNGRGILGGLVGGNNEPPITNSFATGDVTGTNDRVGGLVGASTRFARILNTFATGNVRGRDSVGGLVGQQSGELPRVFDSYATGDVTGRFNVGGLVGENGRGFGSAGRGVINNSYATGRVSGSDKVGGLVGLNSPVDSIIENSYYNNKTGNPSVCAGLSPGPIQCGAVQNNEAFFFNKCNSPTNKWDLFTTPIWGVQAGNHSCLFGIEAGCSQAINDCTPACGNGVLEGTEQCDDGANINGDGCSSTCTFETGFSCTPGVPSSCEVDLCARIIPVDGDGDGFREISNCCQLAAVRNNIGAVNYELTNNIDCNVAPFNTGEGFEPIGAIGSFGYHEATFNGSGFNITGLFINRPTTNRVGLFGFTSRNPVNRRGARIQDLGLLNVNITGRDDTGALIGQGGSSLVLNSFATGTVIGKRGTGGLMGRSEFLTLLHFEGNVSGSRDVGGLIGASARPFGNSFAKGTVFGSLFQVGGLVGAARGNVFNSYAEVDVSSNAGLTGGLLGRIDFGSITNSNASGRVTSLSGAVGGLVGSIIGGDIINSSATGNVSGTSTIGGLAGQALRFVNNSFATGNVSGSSNFVGGLIGQNVNTGKIFNSFASGDVSGRDEVGGLVGRTTGTIDESNATGNVVGRLMVGGFVGRNGISSNNGIISNSFSSGDVTGSSILGGFGGQQENAGSVMGNVSWLNTTGNPDVCVASILAGTVDCTAISGITDSDGDGINDDVDNCVTDFNPDQSDLDSQDGGDICDVCPADATDTCPAADSAGENVDASGGTVTSTSGEVNISIPSGALSTDTSISMTKGGSNFAIIVPGRGSGTVLYEYTLGIPGTTFAALVTLTFTFDPGAGTPDVYRDDGAGFVGLGFDCTTTAGVCTGTVTKFSNFALIVPTDSDNDTVPDNFDNVTDFCNNTVLPEVLSGGLAPRNFADVDGDGVFETNAGSKKNPEIVDSSITMADTKGCSCAQILAFKPGKDEGELKFGCSKGTMDNFVKGRGWAKDITGSSVLNVSASSWLGFISVLSIIALVIVTLSAFDKLSNRKSR